ncbi:MAG: hypothetical protein HY820_43175 [Acidobacteria bacterium]|nr:hypothetical protein [Acidobacteriota bacterium]
MFARFALCLILVASAGAQTKKQAASPPKTEPPAIQPSKTREFPIARLTVNGNRIFPTENILKVAGLKLGDPANEKIFEAARDRLLQCGYFESVGFQFGPAGGGDGYAASFEVIEIAQSYAVRFERLNKPDAELRALLQKADPLFHEKAPGTKQLLERYARLLEAVVGEKVIGQVTPDGPADLKIVFRPQRMPPSIAEVDFEKNTVIPTAALRNAIAGVAVGAVFEEARFRQILDVSLRPLYEARGRLRVAFPKINAKPVADVNGLKVTVEVNEGESYQFGELTVEAPTGAPKSDMLRVADIKKGDLANFDEVRGATDRMKELMRKRGYLKTAITVDRKIDDAKKLVDLTAKVEPGRQYKFARLDIKGLDIISEPIVRKMWGVKEGQPFNPDYPDYFLKGVRDEGVLDNLGKTRSESKLNDETGEVEVTLNFTGEAPKPKKPDPDPPPLF